MPSPSTSRPSSRVRHGITNRSAAAWNAGRSVHGDIAGERDACRSARAWSPGAAAPAPAGRSRRSAAGRAGPAARTCGHASIRTSWPLRGTSRRQAQDQRLASARCRSARRIAAPETSGCEARRRRRPGGMWWIAVPRGIQRSSSVAGVAADDADRVHVAQRVADRRAAADARHAGLVAMGQRDTTAAGRRRRAPPAAMPHRTRRRRHRGRRPRRGRAQPATAWAAAAGGRRAATW